MEFTASAELHRKLQLARNLLSHAIPSGDLATLFERALDELLRAETKRRFGADSPRKRRPLRPGSRHVPVDVVRAVWERDGSQCTHVDEQGRRCSATLFLTLEHKDPFARGGPPSVENLCLLCKAHNLEAARQVFGEKLVEQKIESEIYAKVQSALENLGFERKRAKRTLEQLREQGAEAKPEQLLRRAVAALCP